MNKILNNVIYLTTTFTYSYDFSSSTHILITHTKRSMNRVSYLSKYAIITKKIELNM